MTSFLHLPSIKSSGVLGEVKQTEMKGKDSQLSQGVYVSLVSVVYRRRALMSCGDWLTCCGQARALGRVYEAELDLSKFSCASCNQEFGVQASGRGSGITVARRTCICRAELLACSSNYSWLSSSGPQPIQSYRQLVTMDDTSAQHATWYCPSEQQSQSQQWTTTHRIV